MSERRQFTAGLAAVMGALGCKRKPTTHRVPTLGHPPWVLWPEGSRPAGGFPLLVFLHGQGEAAWVVEGDNELERGPEAVLSHQSPPALHRARDARVPTLWKRFGVFAPQAVNDEGVARYWRWHDASVQRRVIEQLDQVLSTGWVDRTRIYAAGFSRGGLGCLQLDGRGPLQFRKLVTADAQALDGLPEVIARGREVRLYYARTTFDGILSVHRAAETEHARAAPQVRFFPTDVPGNDGAAHVALGEKAFTNDELYSWLLS